MFAYIAEVPGVMARRAPDPESVEAIAGRLKSLRKALKLTQAVMAGSIGSASGAQMWANYEAGDRRISLDQALALCRRFGVTLEWVYRGQIQSLPVELAEKIRFQELRAAEEEQPLNRRAR